VVEPRPAGNTDTAQFLLRVEAKALGTLVLERGGDHAPSRVGVSRYRTIAGALGVSGVAAVATNIAYVLFVIAIGLFLVHLLSGRRTLAP
jgi:uncharacterized membrane protein YtjA (UPF0391 family)